MKKVKFKRLLPNGVAGDTEEGYLVTVHDHNFAVAKLDRYWTATHIPSGLKVGLGGTTRKKAIQQIEDTYKRVGYKKWHTVINKTPSLDEVVKKKKEHDHLWKKLTNTLKRNPRTQHITLPIDGLLSMVSGKRTVDIVKMDSYLARIDRRYDSRAGTFDGRKCSMNEAMEYILGKEFTRDFDKLIAL